MSYRVLCCGSNGNFQLGLGNDEDQDVLQSAGFVTPDGVVTELSCVPEKVVCGGNHTFILLANGDLYSCGENTYGQCAQELHTGHVKQFRLVAGKWKDVAAGWEHSVLVNCNNEVFTCGYGPKGELGQGENTKLVSLKKVVLPVETAYNIVKIKCSISHTILMLSDGTLLGWGNCRKGQLGSVCQKVLWLPAVLDFGVPADDFEIGRDITFLRSGRTITAHGKPLVKENSLKSPSDIVQFKAMWLSVHYSFIQGRIQIKSYGNNSHSQLYDFEDVRVEAFETGSEHGLVLSKNQVFSWGWGEHGNCGVHTKPSRDEVTFDYLNSLYSMPEQVLLLGAGCATSWVVQRV